MKKILIWVLASVLVFLLVVFALVFIPPKQHTVIDGINQQKVGINHLGTKHAKYNARDGEQLFYRYFPSSQPTNKVLILIHGLTVDSAGMMTAGRAVADAGHADVYMPDVRGHGHSAVPLGHADYIGQLEHDLSDLITYIKKAKPEAEVLAAGHSAGGGLLIRYIGNDEELQVIDRYLLIAPFMGANAPTGFPQDPDAEYDPDGEQVHVRRIVGLMMLNAVGVDYFNDLTVLYRPIPLDNPYPSIRVRAYSLNLLISFGPRDYASDLAGLHKPLDVWIGEQDDAFDASKYPETFKPFNVDVEILPGLDHNTIVMQPEFIEKFNNWVSITN